MRIYKAKDYADMSRKAANIISAFFGPVTPAIPASILQLHNDVIIVGDESALAQIRVVCGTRHW